jgi:TetR/AcrR family transcriptional regulator, cholesterol catabolism regulator
LKQVITEDTKTKLVNAALFLFEKNGYSGTSISEILERAGLTKGAFYHYFQSKEDVLVLIHEDYLSREIQNIKSIYYNDTLTNKEKLSKLIYFLFNSLEKYKEHYSIFFQEYKYITDEKFAPIRKQRDEMSNYFINIIDDGILKGEFRKNINSKIIVFGIVGISGWGLHWYSKDGPLSINEIVQQYLDMIFDGIDD